MYVIQYVYFLYSFKRAVQFQENLVHSILKNTEKNNCVGWMAGVRNP